MSWIEGLSKQESDNLRDAGRIGHPDCTEAAINLKLECGHEYLTEDCPVCEKEYWKQMGRILNEDRYER